MSSYACSSPFLQDYSSNFSNLQQFSTHAIRRFSSIYKLGKTKITIYIGLITSLGRNNTKASCSLNILNTIHNTNHIVFVTSLNTSNRRKVKKIVGRLLSKQQCCNLIKTIHKAFELHIQDIYICCMASTILSLYEGYFPSLLRHLPCTHNLARTR